MPINSSSIPALRAARAVKRRKRAAGGGIFDYSGVGAAMPEAYGAEAPVRDLAYTVPKSVLYDLPKKAIEQSQQNPLPGLRRTDFTDVPADTSPDEKSAFGGIGVKVPKVGWQPVDPMVGSSLEAAASVAGAPLVGAPVAKAGEAVLGAGAIRRAPKALDEVDAAIEAERKLAGASDGPRPAAEPALPAEPAAATVPGEMGPGGGGAIRAYHGSPHDFDKFDLSKIGTGEGAQAYGHGLYFAENEGVAKSYRDTLANDLFARRNGEMWDPMSLQHLNVRSTLNRTGDLDAAIARAREVIPGAPEATGQMARTDLSTLEALKAEGGISRGKGNMYEVNINSHPEHFLDWDKPLSEQSQHVRDAIAKADSSLSTREPSLSSIKDPEIRSIVRRALKQNDGNAQGLELAIDNDSGLYNSAVSHAKRGKVDLDAQDMRASDYIYQQAKPYIDALHAHQNMVGDSLGKVLGVKGADMMQAGPAAARLREAGLPGIKYLDQGSRAAGDGSRNYVVFDHNLIDIVKKYAVAGIVLPPTIAAEYAEMQKRNEGDQEGGLSDLSSEGQRLHKDRGGAAVEPIPEMDGVADRESSGVDLSDIQRGWRGRDGEEPSPQVRSGFDSRGMVSSKGRSSGHVGRVNRGAIPQGNGPSSGTTAASHGMAAGAIKRATPSRRGNGRSSSIRLVKKDNVASRKEVGRSQGGRAGRSDNLEPALRAQSGRSKKSLATGGGVNAAMDVARRIKRAKGGKVHVGPIVGNTGGRADKVPMEVPDSSYVIPADIVSGLGEGNSGAGMVKLSKMFPESKPSLMRELPKSGVKILAADGEFVVSPTSIEKRWGDAAYGHKSLDAWVLHERKHLIDTLQGLPGPAQD